MSIPEVEWRGEVVLTTPRLLLRTFRREDLPVYAALNADPEVMRYIGGVPLTRGHSDEIASWAQWKWTHQHLGLLAVERRADGSFLGMCGLHHQESFPDDVEIAWRLAREQWGHGYATEASTAWLDYAFETLGVPSVISVTDPANTRSLAVMARLGMAFDHETGPVVDDGVTYPSGVVYWITAEQWRNRSIALRRATDDDADTVAGVHVAAFDATYEFPGVHSDEEVRRWIRDVVLPTQEVWVATAPDGLVVAVMALDADMVEQLYVAPGWTGRGIGSRLLALAKERRPDGLELWTFQVNARARRFYERHGFVEVDRTDGGRNEERQPDVRYAWRPGA